MKKVLFTLVVSILALSSCKKEASLKADFTLDKDSCKPGEEVLVKNCSSAVNTEIDLCKWEWDGKVSYENEIGKISFSSVGDYTVTLTVYAKDGVVEPSSVSRVVKVVDDTPGGENQPGGDTPPSGDKKFYVTVTGSGTLAGDSWENAMSPAKMWEKLKGTDISGAVFHLGAGEYELNANPLLAYTGSSPVVLAFKGDYPANGGPEQVRGGSSRASFTGKGSHGALILRGKIDVTFDGIGFIDSYGTADEDAEGVAAALDCDGKDAAYPNSELSVTMTYCFVKGNTNRSYATGSHDDEWGAGIRLRGVKSFVADSVSFAHNCSHAGAAVCFRETKATLSNCLFVDNETYYKAGACYLSGGSDVNFSGCTFEGNSAQTGAGGVFYQNGKSTGSFTDCSFIGNKAVDGAGITLVSGFDLIEGGCFSGNEASYGGVFYVENNGEGTGVKIVKSGNGRTQFLGNVAKEKGGVIWSSTKGTDERKNISFADVVFKGNHATSGGACYIAGNNSGFTATGCEFGGTGENDPNYATGSTSGSDFGAGSIYLQDRSHTTLTNCNFTGEHSRRWGGAIYCNTDKGSLTIENCFFTDCYTTGCGGAIIAGFKNFGELTIKGGAFVNCYSTDGGAILVDGKSGSELKIYKWNDTEGTLFKNNHVIENTQQGGAVKIQHTVTSKLFGTEFIGNHAGRGGAIYISGSSTVYLDACSFDANYIADKWGTTVYAWAAAEFMMNNSSMRGSYTTNGNPDDVNNARPAWMYFDSMEGPTGISNSTIIGDPTYYDGSTFTPLTANNTCLVCTSGTCYLTNSIILPETPSIHSVEGDYADGAHEDIDAYYSCYCDLYGYKTLTDSGGNTSSLSKASLGALSWDSGCWAWNGLIGGAAPVKAGYDGIFERMKQISPDFVSWLGGDFEYDQRHVSRSTGVWWPGAYQAN